MQMEVESSEAASASQPSRVASGSFSLAEPIKLEYQLVKVPFEALKKSIRGSSRAAEKEIGAVIKTVDDVGKKEVSSDKAFQQLTSCMERLSGLKRKLGEMYENEELEMQRTRARLSYLHDMSEATKDPEWKKKKLDRLLVDYLLRSSYIQTANKLIEASSLQDVTDLQLFREAQQVIDGLNGNSCTKALAWCSDNKGKLKKADSQLEFKLRLQEFVELARAQRRVEAVHYARKFLAPLASVNLREFQEAVTLLVLPSTSEAKFRKVLLDENRWDKLIQLFKEEFCKIHGMTAHSLLHIHFQAGLSALKTPSCYEEQGCTREDPLSLEIIRKLAEPLPFMKHSRSKLVCYITKELMDDTNPPLVLPNGYVYSTQALHAMASKNNGRVTCPRTGAEFPLSSATRAFIS